MSMDVCPEEEAASVHLHRGAFKAGDDLYAFLLTSPPLHHGGWLWELSPFPEETRPQKGVALARHGVSREAPVPP